MFLGSNPPEVGCDKSRNWTRYEEFKNSLKLSFYAVSESESGTKVAEITRRLGISQATFSTWKKKYGNMGVTELKRLRALENAQLQKLVADLNLGK